MFDLRFKIWERRSRACSRCAPRTSKILNLKSNIQRPALTLIELLVVIIILTTLVAGVIPVLSPNNDTKKIREAARGLQSYITLAQSQAARTGRPHGIAFRESSADSGVALDVFQLEVPPAFAGFSSSSTAIVRVLNAANYQFEIQLGEGAGSSFVAGTGFDVPLKFTRPGDVIDIGGWLFRLVDDSATPYNGQMAASANGVIYFAARSKYSLVELINSGRDNLVFNFGFEYTTGSGTFFWTNPKQYKIIRQPTNSTESPYQLPAGVAIDLQASGLEGGTNPSTAEFPVNSFYTPAIDTTGIMFSPTGAIESVYFNNNRISTLSKIFLCIGRVENGVPPPNAYDFSTANISNDELKQRQEVVNWLNLDSRWLFITAQNGRAVVAENAFVDPRNNPPLNDSDPAIAVPAQLEAAHQFAHEMKSGGGG